MMFALTAQKVFVLTAAMLTQMLCAKRVRAFAFAVRKKIILVHIAFILV